ncbi:MAG: preprotein translocase subunit [Planctomycetota bacterium]|nr:MAG: preprotein translocase subunit [Planctomycetota bacterium]
MNPFLLAQATPESTGTPPAPAGGGTTSTGAPADPPATGGSEPQSGNFSTMILFFGLTLAVMYFLMIRPQQKKERDLKEMVNRLKKNDKVVLQGGIFAVVAQVREKDVIVKIDEKNDVRIRVLKSAVLGVEGKPGESKAPEPESKAETASDDADEKAEEKSGAGK